MWTAGGVSSGKKNKKKADDVHLRPTGQTQVRKSDSTNLGERDLDFISQMLVKFAHGECLAGAQYNGAQPTVTHQ